MKFFTVIIISLFAISGCSNIGTTRNVNGNSVLNIEDPEDFSSIAYVDYFDYQFLVLEEKEKSELVFEKPNLSKIPKHGYIVAHVSTPSIESANTKYWQVVIKDNSGTVVKKIRGNNNIAHYIITSGLTVWKNSIIVDLPNITPPFDVFVVSDITKNRWGYRVLAK